MTLVKEVEDRKDGIKKFEISNQYIKVVVSNIGCRVLSIFTPDKDGKMDDIILGVENIEDYAVDGAYMGAVVGRVANRIENAKFDLNGITYNLQKNNGDNHLHGGAEGFDKKIFSHEFLDDGIRFRYSSKDGEEGYPGQLDVLVDYTIKDNNFVINYEAESNKDTLVNLTNHMYFNLTGCNDNILSHSLMVKADKIACVDENCLANGEFLDVKNTPFDFNVAKTIGKDIDNDSVQLKNAAGYDHSFILNASDKQIVLESLEVGRRLTITTSAPAVQVYTGNFLSGGCVGKLGKLYKNRDGVALETQLLPNSINIESEPSVILRKGEKYKSYTAYCFEKI